MYDIITPLYNCMVDIDYVFAHSYATVWLSLSRVFVIYRIWLRKFLYGDVVGDVF